MGLCTRALLRSALERFESNGVATGWFPEGFAGVHRAHKQAEIDHLDGLDTAARCAAYEATY